MEQITELELVKIGKDQEYYVYRFGLFFSAGVNELNDDYGFRFIVSKDFSSSYLVNDRGSFKSISIEDVLNGINAIKTLSNVTNGIYNAEVLEELIVTPPKYEDMDVNEFN